MDATNYAKKGEAIDKDALSKALASNHQQIRNIAEIIQRVRPDVILLNEFDYIDADKGINVFRKNYLQVSQNKQVAIDYPYYFIAPVNTGLPTEFDLDNDGVKGHYKGDAHGFGFFDSLYPEADSCHTICSNIYPPHAYENVRKYEKNLAKFFKFWLLQSSRVLREQ